MDPGFISPPRASRTVAMSSTRVKIINPLSLPSSDNSTESRSGPQDLQQNVPKYSGSETNYSTPKQQPNYGDSSRLVLEPISLASSMQNDLPAGTSSTMSTVSERLEFPSSTLDLYTTLLQESEHSTSNNELQTVDLTSDKSHLEASRYLGEATTSSSLEVPTDSSSFGGYLPLVSGESFSKQVDLSSNSLSFQEDSSSTDNLDAIVGIQDAESSLDITTRSVEPAIDFASEGGMDKKEEVIFDSRCVDSFQEMVDTLPDVVENVSQAQRHQLAEVAKQQHILHQIKEMLVKEKDRLDELVAELKTSKRKICVSEDKGAQLQKQCKQLGKDITETVTEDFEIQMLTRNEEEMLAENQRSYERYRSKMADHSKTAEEVEANMGVHEEVKKQQDMIAVLQVEKTAMEFKLKEGISNTSKIQQKIKVSSAEKKALGTQIINVEAKIKSECDKHTGINQDIEVLRKRNQAQMTRLKKQIKEAHLRNRQWNVEACQLEKHLEELRKSMEE